MGQEKQFPVFSALVIALVLAGSMFQGCVYVSGKGLFRQGTGPFEEKLVTGSGKEKILLLDISGIISEAEKDGIFNLRPEPSMVTSVVEQLEKASRDENVKGILLQINSPGGTVTATDILYHEIVQFKKKHNLKVVAMLMGTAASGGYYLAQAADKIIAHPTSVTGSIGVLLLNLNLGGLFDKIGISDQSVKSGSYKDMGSPLRKPQEGEKEILQSVVNDLHNQFCAIVQENRRGVNLQSHPEVTDGRIFTAQQALQLGLIDRVGYFEEALDLMNKEAGLSRSRLIRYLRPGEYQPTVYAGMHEMAPKQINLLNISVEALRIGSGPTFMYLWLPGS